MKARHSRSLCILLWTAAALIAAGCAGPSGPASPFPSSGQAPALQPASATRPATQGGGAPSCPQGDRCGYRAVAALAFDGTNFTEVASRWPCFPDLWRVPVYAATSSGPLALSSTSISLPATCSSSDGHGHGWIPFSKPGLTPTPSPVPATTPTPTSGPTASPTASPGAAGPLYIVAYQVGWNDSDRLHKGRELAPYCGNLKQSAAIAGPAAFADDPWVFPVIPNALTLQSGSNYIFLVAEYYAIPQHGGWHR
ncbi:MAG TPA: hypothetical protein VMF61_01470 [Candidatus Acidoferrales bacterium]|nr:hypothetical protein [Candidatus Acidoferrales bacterium]